MSQDASRPIEIATLRIELADTKPPIWRELEVPTAISLHDLHEIIQASMGWLDYHLWEFTAGKRRLGLPMDEDWGAEPREEASKVQLREVLAPGNRADRFRTTNLTYVYDFGDDWVHKLTIKDVRHGEPGTAYPRYIAGQHNAPPEDCGGIPGFHEMLEAAADPKHQNHAEIRKWLGKYNPDTVNERAIKAALTRIAKRLYPTAQKTTKAERPS